MSILAPQSPGREVLSTARDMLEERVTAKAQKCAFLTGRIWLALREDFYGLPDLGDYKSALSSLAGLPHPFEKILLIGHGGNVEFWKRAPGAHKKAAGPPRLTGRPYRACPARPARVGRLYRPRNAI